MKKIILFAMLISLFLCVFANAKIALEGEDLVVYEEPTPPKEIKRYTNPFDPSIKPGEISPEVAMQLLEGEIKEHPAGKEAVYEKVLFWHFPIQLSGESISYNFQLNHEGIIIKTASDSKEKFYKSSWDTEIPWRVIPCLLILLSILYRDNNKLKQITLFCWITSIISIIIAIAINILPQDTVLASELIIFTISIVLIIFNSSNERLFITSWGFIEFFSIAVINVYGFKNSAILEYAGFITVVYLISFCLKYLLVSRQKKSDEAKAIQISANP